MGKSINVFTIGCDPEFMLRGNAGNLVSAVPIISGTKDKPTLLDNGSHLSSDNVSVEFATKVCGSMRDFLRKIRSSFLEVNKHLPSRVSMHAEPAAFFPKAELQTQESQEFGCDPDFNAWTLEQNEMPDISKNPRLRSCGGHIHVGQRKGYIFLKDPRGKILMVQVMDAVLGVISVTFDKSIESRMRRELYGKAGSHRPTDYGVEYRVLSNFWLKSPRMCQLMYSLVGDCLDIIEADLAGDLINEISKKDILEIINEGLEYKAKRVISNILPAFLSRRSKYLLRKVRMENDQIEKLRLDQNWKLAEA